VAGTFWAVAHDAARSQIAMVRTLADGFNRLPTDPIRIQTPL
jgi:hypothetical protein